MKDTVKSEDLFDRKSNGDADQFLIVGLGASAGGIRALQDFFANVPENSGMAYVVILHLSPDHESKLAEVLQSHASIPVRQVQDRIRVEPNHIYVISPNQSLAMSDGHLALSSVTRFEERRAPIDIFFRTLAESHHSHAVSVVLSGSGADGSMGMKRVKELGGVCIAQDPDEAEYGDMPTNSIATGLVDYVLPVGEIPATIIAYKKQLSTIQIPVDSAERNESDEKALREIFTQLRVRTGHDFSNYKRSTLLRRIERRIRVHVLPDLPAYAQFFREHEEEANALLKDLLISVTNFFRDPNYFDVLERAIILRLLENKGEQDEVRVWVAGCATGEEAYSVAMLLAEVVTDQNISARVQIFATDIDEWAILKAREGYYTINDAADVSPDRLKQFFTKDGDGYRVRPELREMILFASHNLIKDPPFSHIDLVTCRNLLIYLNQKAQQRVLEMLHFALNPGGYLFLGSSESIEGSGDLFIPVDKESHIFRSRPIESRLRLSIPDVSFTRVPWQDRPVSQNLQQRIDRLTYLDLHQRLLEEYGPPSVVVNEEFDIVHLSPGAGRYLEFPGGEPSNNLLRVARSDLRLELRTALYQATQKQTNVEVPNLTVNIDNQSERVDLIVRPVVRTEDAKLGFILVLFRKSESNDAQPEIYQVSKESEPLARHLDEELVHAKQQLRATVEQYEMQQEEFKASNEELQATNEELRTSTEELKTSKEELQSVNEELTTVNQELKIKIEELSQANNDFLNLMNSTQIATIFLDRTMRVKLFTPQAGEIFKLIPTDTGRPLLDITSNLVYQSLAKDIDRVLEKLQPVDRQVETHEGRLYLMRILPYRTSDDHISGVVITFVDVTEVRHAEEMERWLAFVVGSSNDGIISYNAAGEIMSWNRGAERIFGYTESEAVGQPLEILIPPSRLHERPLLFNSVLKGEALEHFETVQQHKDNSLVAVSLTISPIVDDKQKVIGLTSIVRDISMRLKSEEDLRQAHSDLEDKIEERTRELTGTNESLRREVIARVDAEKMRIGLLRRIVSAQEDERRRVARDLHDQMGQQLTALRLKLETMRMNGGMVGSETQLEQIETLARQIETDVDYLARELRPAALDDIGLSEALRNYVSSWSEHFNIPAEFHSSGLDGERLLPAVETNLYRIAQEALNNVYKHANTARVDVIIERRDEYVVLIIEDSGDGFDVDKVDHQPPGMGLMSMRERAALIGGTVEIESSDGDGTTIYVRVPVSFLENES